MSFKDFVTEDRRLFILRLLMDIGGSGNESVIYTGCRAAGHRRGVTRDVVRADLEWLRTRHLVIFEWYEDTVLVAILTSRGADVASGDVEVEGVKRPTSFR